MAKETILRPWSWHELFCEGVPIRPAPVLDFVTTLRVDPQCGLAPE